MEPLDISTIFGNAIDNAIEASENLPEYKRLITVKAERVRDMLLITIKTICRRETISQRKPQRKTAFAWLWTSQHSKGRGAIRRPVQH